jgi:two-component system sensor histidine kinase CpxA
MNIFARTLLSFWISTALTLALAGGLLFSRKPLPHDQIQELPIVRLETCAKSLVAGVEVAGSDLASKLAQDPNCPVQFLVSPTGQQLLQNTVPANISHLITEQLRRGGGPLVEMRPGATVIALRVLGKFGAYCAVAILPQSDPGPPSLVFWVHLLCATAISCVVFWLLARQLTRPIRDLQGVAENVAQGNLTHRPSRELLNRKDELGELSVSIDFMVQKISQLMTSQKVFLAQVSHELGSPLARLNLALALARRKAAPALDSEFNRLEYESAELNSMIQQLLLLARLENASELNHSRQRFSLAQIVEEVTADAMFEANQSEKGVRLLLSDKERWDTVEVSGNGDLLKRALDNILRNAIRFTAANSSVEIRCSVPNANEANITVRDFGEGVLPEQFGAIFEPFVRLPSRGNGSGAGLGLAIAKQTVISHGGSVYASNADTGGLSITIQLPVAPAVNRSERIVTFPGGVAH